MDIHTIGFPTSEQHRHQVAVQGAEKGQRAVDHVDADVLERTGQAAVLGRSVVHLRLVPRATTRSARKSYSAPFIFRLDLFGTG